VAVKAEELFIAMNQFTVVADAANWWQEHRVQ
jgi:hypothetical protein